MKKLGIIFVVLFVWAVPVYATSSGENTGQQSVKQDTSSHSPPKHHVMADLRHYLEKVQPLLDKYGYAAVFVAVMVEGFGIPAPGQTLLMAGSIAAASGGMHIAWLLATAVFAALLGNSIGYALGRYGGRTILDKFRVNENKLKRVENLFDRYGGGLILFARFLDGLRQLNGIMAGVLKMRWWLFSVYNVLGAVLWVFFWGLGLFYLDKDAYLLRLALHHLTLAIAILAISVLALLTVYVLLRRASQSGKNESPR